MDEKRREMNGREKIIRTEGNYGKYRRKGKEMNGNEKNYDV